ncbi:MAG: hypothetical protein ABIF09_03415 [Gemmatimonadota bacterium]
MARTRRKPLPLVTLPILLISALAAGAPAITLSAQDQGPAENAPQLLNVFLDCHLILSCDTDHFRREITFVNWVRQREDAHIHLILTYTPSGAGNEYQFDNIGLGTFRGMDSHVTWTSSNVNSRDEIINAITRTMALGFVPYAQRLGLAEQLRVEFQAADAIQRARQTRNVQAPGDDPWDSWVVRLNARADLSGEDKRKVRNFNGTISADRITDDLKLEFAVTGSFNETRNQLSSGSWFTSDRKSWSATGVAVKSLTDHWSLGSQFGGNSSSVANRRAGYRAAPALEWNLFPYSESTRQQLIFMYQVGFAWVDWWEETIYLETEEWVFDHRLRVDLNFRQPWGNGGTAFQVGSLLDDFDKWEMTLSGTMNIRLFRGFSFNVGGDYAIIRNQIGLRRRNLSDEEIFTARRELETDSSYELNFGFTFDFGSVFNNVVNTRFPVDVRGALF